MFKPEHYKALVDNIGKEVADELNELHEHVFPGKNKPEEPEGDKSE